MTQDHHVSSKTCTACHGEGVIHTGIDESPTTQCGKCDGSGEVFVQPVRVASVLQAEPTRQHQANIRALRFAREYLSKLDVAPLAAPTAQELTTNSVDRQNTSNVANKALAVPLPADQSGWKLVPKQPTPKMIRAATALIRNGQEPFNWQVYDAMLAAAPLPLPAGPVSSATVPQGFAWPEPPPRTGQSSVLFDDGYVEGWARAIDTVRALLEGALNPPAVQEARPDDFVMPPFAAPAVTDLPPLPTQPEELRARWKCEDCDGRGHDGELHGGDYFQPPEHGRCGSCDGSGQHETAALLPEQAAEYGKACFDAGRRFRAQGGITNDESSGLAIVAPPGAQEAAYLIAVPKNEFYNKGNGWLEVSQETWGRTAPELRRTLYPAPASAIAPVQDEEIRALSRQLADEKLRADQGWQRYESANRDRNDLRAALAAKTAPGQQPSEGAPPPY